MEPEPVNRFYDHNDLSKIEVDTLETRPLVRQLRELRELEATWAHAKLYTCARWVMEGLPITFTDCTIRPLPDGRVEFVARGKPLKEPAKLPDLNGKKAIVVASLKTLDEEIEDRIAPYFTLNGAVNILEILLGVGSLRGQKSKQKRFREFFESRGIELPQAID